MDFKDIIIAIILSFLIIFLSFLASLSIKEILEVKTEHIPKTSEIKVEKS